jgi:hypothetical protein
MSIRHLLLAAAVSMALVDSALAQDAWTVRNYTGGLDFYGPGGSRGSSFPSYSGGYQFRSHW